MLNKRFKMTFKSNMPQNKLPKRFYEGVFEVIDTNVLTFKDYELKFWVIAPVSEKTNKPLKSQSYDIPRYDNLPPQFEWALFPYAEEVK